MHGDAMKPLWTEKFTTADAIAVCGGRFDSQGIRNHRRRGLLIADTGGEMQGHERVLSLLGIYELAFLAANAQQGVSYPSSARVFYCRLDRRGNELSKNKGGFVGGFLTLAREPGALPEFEGGTESDPWYWIARAEPSDAAGSTDSLRALGMFATAVRHSRLSKDMTKLPGVAWLFNITALVNRVDDVLIERLKARKAGAE